MFASKVGAWPNAEGGWRAKGRWPWQGVWASVAGGSRRARVRVYILGLVVPGGVWLSWFWFWG